LEWRLQAPHDPGVTGVVPARCSVVAGMITWPPMSRSSIGDLWGDRSVQIEDRIVYLSHGQIIVANW
jgi:hypothetical protein